MPYKFSEDLAQRLKTAGAAVDLHTYPGADHNIAQGFGTAMRRSVEFFDKYLK